MRFIDAAPPAAGEGRQAELERKLAELREKERALAHSVSSGALPEVKQKHRRRKEKPLSDAKREAQQRDYLNSFSKQFQYQHETVSSMQLPKLGRNPDFNK